MIPPMIEVPDAAEAFWALFAYELAKPLPPIPLADTPIYAELKAEEFDRTLASVKSTFTQSAKALQTMGEVAQTSFASVADLEHFAARAIAEHRTTLTANQIANTRPIDRHTFTKPAKDQP